MAFIPAHARVRAITASIAFLTVASMSAVCAAQDAAPDSIAIAASTTAPVEPTAVVAELPPPPESGAPPVIEPTPLNPLRISPGRPNVPMFGIVPSLARVRIRAGITFPSFGVALGPVGGAAGTGIGLQLGAQIDRTAVYFSGRIETLLATGYFETAAIVEYELNGRVQLGTGTGVLALFGYNRILGPAIVFPVHVGVTAMQWRTRYRGRTGLHLDLDIEPGVALGDHPNMALAFHLGLGWAWL